jgi:transposase
MYVRTIQRRNKDGSVVRYLQLAHNVRKSGGQPAAKVIHSFGREDRLDREALARLVRSIGRFLEPEQALKANESEELRFLSSRPMGGAWALDGLWRALGIDKAIAKVAEGRKVSPEVERLIFALVANRALAPSSKRAALEWARSGAWLPGIDADIGEDPQVLYRAMDFLLDADEEVQREVFFSVSDLLNLEVDLILFDTSTTYFETEAEDEEGLRAFGASKDRRPDRPQVVVGMAVTKEGIPVRCFTFAGNASDQRIIRQVKDELREWRLHRVIWVCDTGFASAENRTYLQRAGGHYILGEKLRQGSDNLEALSRPGRYQTLEDGLEVKEVWVGEGAERRRFVVARNRAEWVRDFQRRKKATRRLEAELEALDGKRGEAARRAEAELIVHPTLKRYLTREEGRLAIDHGKVKAEESLDGKFLLSSSDDDLSAEQVARYYKQLKEVERGWRDQKHVLGLRPVYHHKDERIRAHVLLCFLALLLIRVAETRAADTWPNLRRELQRIHLGEFSGSAGQVRQRTEITTAQAEILRTLEVEEPPRFLDIEPAAAA